LTVVQGTIQLENNTAAAWLAMKSGAATAGIAMSISSPAGGYRSLAMQQDMIDHPANYNIIPGAVLAPAGSSTHGYGTCVDISTTGANNWAVSHASAYGFIRDRYPAQSYEYNHWHYIGTVSGGGSARTAQQGDDMGSYYVRYTSSNPNEWIAINDLDKTYRIIPPGSWEDGRLTLLDQQGLLFQINIADPTWGQTYGLGQFRQIT